MLLSVLKSLLIKGVSDSDSVFMGISITLLIAVTIFCAFASRISAGLVPLGNYRHNSE